MKQLFGFIWSKETHSIRGLPRPYYVVPKNKRKTQQGVLAKRIPIPWQTIPLFHIPNTQLKVDLEHEEEVYTQNVCGYCGLGFLEEELCVIWVTYQDNFAQKINRVYSDHFPFHVECMRQTRLFCPHMQQTNDSEYEIGPFKELLPKACAFKAQADLGQQEK